MYGSELIQKMGNSMNYPIGIIWLMADLHGNIQGFNDIPDQAIAEYWVPITEITARYLQENNVGNLNEIDSLVASPNGTLMLVEEYKAYFGEIILGKIHHIYCIRSQIETIQKRAEALHDDITLKDYLAFYTKSLSTPLTDVESMVLSAAFLWWRNAISHKLYQIRPDAAALIANARLDDSGTELETIYLGSVDGYLFDIIREILIYPVDDGFHILLSLPNNQCVSGLIEESSADNEIDQIKAAAVKYTKIFIELLRCEKSPIENVSEKSVSRKKQGNMPQKEFSPVIYSTISLTKRYRYKKKIGKKLNRSLGKDDKDLVLVDISGYFKNQAYGPGYSQHRRIWIDAFKGNRWVKNGLHYVTVAK